MSRLQVDVALPRIYEHKNTTFRFSISLPLEKKRVQPKKKKKERTERRKKI